MRTIVELPEEQIEALRALASQTSLSRAELIRRAISEYLARQQTTASDEAAFGLWKGRGKDGLDYQETLRAEWDR